MPVLRLALLLLVLVGGLALGGCALPARLLNLPFDPGGRTLNSPYRESRPRIAGRYIVFASDRLGTERIFLYDAVRQRLEDLPGLNALDLSATSPAVSLDGQTIVFSGRRQGEQGIYLYDRPTRQLRNLTAGLKADVRSPTISADGQRIAFAASINGQWESLVYSRQGEPLFPP